MNLKLTQFEELLTAVKQFGIIDTTEETKQFETEGLDIILSDVFSTNNEEIFIILKDGSIRKTVIYIVDISNWNEAWKYPMFHIYSCEKIKEMINEGKKHRYKASSRSDGLFYLIKSKKKWYESLEICKYCLDKYNSQFKINKTKQDFPLKEYIKKPIDHLGFVDISIDICTVPNTYTGSWSAISKKIKEQQKYLCSNCKRNFSKPECKRFLHTHHVNADKRNNSRENLQVLCIECHSKEHNHSHIKQNNAYKEYLKSQCYN